VSGRQRLSHNFCPAIFAPLGRIGHAKTNRNRRALAILLKSNSYILYIDLHHTWKRINFPLFIQPARIKSRFV